MADLRGTTIGPYRIDELLGTGGFATVYRGRDQRLDTDVAIKVLADNHSLDPDIRERFLGEAQVLRQVDSAETLTVYDLGETKEGSPFLVLELADRGDLEARVGSRRNDGWTPTGSDLELVADLLASALAALHGNRIIHRDITPRNLLIRSTHAGSSATPKGALLAGDERLLLGDLGLAKDLAARSGITAGSGTSGFAAPEQRVVAATVDERADVYGASALMLWLATGATPGSDSALAKPNWMRDETYRALLQGVADDPIQRPASLEAWRNQLGDLARPDSISTATMREPDSSTSPSTVAPPDSVTGRSAPRRKPWVAISTGLLALVLAATVAIFQFGGVGDLKRVPGDGGLVTFIDTEGDATLAITGPETAPVGRVEYSVEASGVSTWTVTSPSGETYVAPAVVAVTASSAGNATVTVTGTSVGGTQLTTEITTEFSE